ncbi:ABC transporter permease [Halanaerobiaceae bacterium Z-7014]|uniref:ABC transporter permease n=1 Tax=Halonatronomonas betaini TaxID=2778430 RepID=A0A931F8H2_9FIRM|nr:FtsX-like permease family protein [Halonatronomonas betaini]MBF8437726.1 ABC transporter permease [Halonatronomonas betaini]
MYLIKIAWRNLWRRKRRTFVTAGVLALAVFIFLLMDSLMGGMGDISYNNIIDFESAHLEIGLEEYFEAEEDTNRLRQAFPVEDSLINNIEGIDGYQSHVQALDFQANISSGRDEFPLRVRAVEPDRYSQVFNTEEYITDGQFINPGDEGLVIGDRLSRLLEIGVGDYFTLLFRDTTGSFNTIDGEIQGIVSTPHPDMNLGVVLYDINQARQWTGVEENASTRIFVRLDDRERATGIFSDLTNRLQGGLTARSWEDSAEMMLAMEAVGQIENYVILGLILLIGAVGIVNVIILSALERVEEIGMMKAMGLKEKEIVKIFSYEATGIGLIGSSLGCLIAGIVNYFFTSYGVAMDAIITEDTTYGIPILGRLYGSWNPNAFLFIFIFGIIVAMIASIPPAYWAARKDPIKAIYHR